ncbi:hypothetical protein M407DRAFT_21910 [Tulasnella calospora MUT 4182]|uniref:Uncharacterized protein n=1 Tax=Tulasnella calospora MUT 4182 TaxID=1051891 RepID=A0A0C3QMF2_9AGAM|nr:hypothetical protein M407DRAFT_21910 [Tulasnella calospora MUT 4182]
MQDNEHNPADTIRAPGSDHEDPSGKVQLSANTTRRLEKLAQWRIDPSFIKFPEGAPEFEGGYATVSRALLGSSPKDAADQVVESSPGNLKSNNYIPHLEGETRRREAEGSNEETRKKDEDGAGGLEHNSDGETSGRLRVSGAQNLPASPGKR